MTLSLKGCISTLVLTAAFVAAPSVWAADDTSTAAQSGDRLVTEYRGRPPFKRRFLSSDEVATLARFEETESRPTSETVRVTDYRGRPPFKRETVAADEVADLARFEETSSDSDEASRRRGAPGKHTSRR